ncbi:MAG: hypothetical protein ABIL58_08190 [Pseudomonadota bacterium]
MAAKPADFSHYVFRRTNSTNTGEVSLDGQMLKVLMELDGESPLSAVASRLNLDGIQLLKVVSRLLNMKLIVPVAKMESVLPPDFINDLFKALALAVGPVAKMLLEDTIADLGYPHDQIPKNRAASLVEYLAADISRSEKKTSFEKFMLQKIRALES